MIGFISMRLAISGFIVPFVFIYQPDLLLGSDVNIPITIFTFFVTAVGLVYISAAFEGAFWSTVGPARRLIYAGIAIPLLWPDTFISLCALVATAAVLIADILQLRLAKRQKNEQGSEPETA